MSIKSNLLAAVVLSIVAGPVLADAQLAASAGLTPAEAAGMSLNEIAAYKFNREESLADRHPVTIETSSIQSGRSQLAAQAGVSAADWSLMELAIVKFNADTRPDDRQALFPAARVTGISRSYGGGSSNYDQLAASAGLTPAEAQGMTLNEIAAVKSDRYQSTSDRRY